MKLEECGRNPDKAGRVRVLTRLVRDKLEDSLQEGVMQFTLTGEPETQNAAGANSKLQSTEHE